jgi:hypothetical protein
VMSYLYELLGSKDANGRKPLIGQPKPLEAGGMRVVTPTASGASCVLGPNAAGMGPAASDRQTAAPARPLPVKMRRWQTGKLTSFIRSSLGTGYIIFGRYHLLCSTGGPYHIVRPLVIPVRDILPCGHPGPTGGNQIIKLRASPAKATMELPFAQNYAASTSELLLSPHRLTAVY